MSKVIKTYGGHLVDLELLPERPVIIDAGAGWGKFNESLSSQILEYNNMMNPIFFAIEPNKNNIETLKEADYPDTVIIEAALVGSYRPRHMAFQQFEMKGWGNVNGLYSEYTGRMVDNYEVVTINIKELLAAVPQHTVDLLKMDVEGSEEEIISDMTKEHAERIKQITMELHSGARAITTKLEALGYNVKFENGELYACNGDIDG
jgi:FkbM family methyltransferase